MPCRTGPFLALPPLPGDCATIAPSRATFSHQRRGTARLNATWLRWTNNGVACLFGWPPLPGTPPPPLPPALARVQPPPAQHVRAELRCFGTAGVADLLARPLPPSISRASYYCFVHLLHLAAIAAAGCKHGGHLQPWLCVPALLWHSGLLGGDHTAHHRLPTAHTQRTTHRATSRRSRIAVYSLAHVTRNSDANSRACDDANLAGQYQQRNRRRRAT